MTEMLFRINRDTREEASIAAQHFDVVDLVTELTPGTGSIIGRYSVMPNYAERAREVSALGLDLVHCVDQHRFIADMRWYTPLFDLTPATYFGAGWATVPETEHGYVVKGRTTSRKFKWNSHMYAPDREALRAVCHRVHDDVLLSGQGVVIREYIPLATFEEGVNGLPITDEWRLFYWREEFIAGGYYWAQAEHLPEGPVPPDARALGDEAARRLSENGLTFFVVDVGRRRDSDDWVVVEVNSGQMSGLSCVDPQEFYSRLARLSG